jgi:hypothetical protein
LYFQVNHFIQYQKNPVLADLFLLFTFFFFTPEKVLDFMNPLCGFFDLIVRKLPFGVASHDKLVRDFVEHHFLHFVHVVMFVIVIVMVSVHFWTSVNWVVGEIIADGEGT